MAMGTVEHIKNQTSALLDALESRECVCADSEGRLVALLINARAWLGDSNSSGGSDESDPEQLEACL